MHHPIDSLTFLLIQPEDSIQEVHIQYATLVKSNSFFDFRLAQNLGEDSFYPLENVRKTVGEIVDDDNIGVCLPYYMHYCVWTDKAKSSWYEQILNATHH